MSAGRALSALMDGSHPTWMVVLVIISFILIMIFIYNGGDIIRYIIKKIKERNTTANVNEITKVQNEQITNTTLPNISNKTGTTQYCIYCGEKIPADSCYCVKCGRKVPQDK